jgi:hypothetical protein
MTDTLKELFQDALADEPTRPVVPDEDVARGRARRTRLRRQRVSAGFAVVAVAWLGALIAPTLVPDDGAPMASDSVDPDDQVWPYDDGSRDAGRTSNDEPAELSGGSPQSSSGGTEEMAEAGNGGVADELSSAVEGAMPGDVQVLQEDPPIWRGPIVSFTVRRAGAEFGISVRLQDARPDLPEFQPCTTPAEIPDGVARWESCAQGYDEKGRWRIVGHAGSALGVAIAEGGSASAMVTWNPATRAAADGTMTERDLARTLTSSEANRLAEAAWAVGARYDAADLTWGFDMDAVRRGWPDIESVFETATGLGPLTRVELEDDDPSMIRARYVNADDIEVSLTIWQDDRFYDNLCTRERPQACGSRDTGVYDDPRLDNQVLDSRLGDEGLGHFLVSASASEVLGPASEVLLRVIPRRASVTPASSNGD